MVSCTLDYRKRKRQTLEVLLDWDLIFALYLLVNNKHVERWQRRPAYITP